MRNTKRIKKFCNELANIWETKCPDWRFFQLISNVSSSIKSDPFFIEDDKAIDIFKRYFNVINDPILILMGGTASGKDTVQKELVNYKFDKIVTYTTRPPRENEKDKLDYNFISKDTFDSIKDYFFAETNVYHTKFGDWWYGSPINEYINAASKKSVILTPNGVRQVVSLLEKYNKKCVIFYLYAPEEVVRKRLSQRKDDEEEVNRRIEADKKDFSDLNGIDYYKINSDRPVNEIVEDILNIYGENNK